MLRNILPLLCLLLAPALAPGAEPWTTYRGNSQRTGCTDQQPGPQSAKVLWVHKTQEHFVAAPVPVGDRLFVSGLGAFNSPAFLCLDTTPKPANRVVWTKGTPLLKLPTVSSPAVFDGKLIFGDGMHQTDGAILHCLRQDNGLPLWQLPVPGDLVHLEGSPTLAGGKLYLGGGAAGVLCVDVNRVMLEGKEMDLAAIQKLLDAKWKAMLAKYEEEKKKDELAVPPSEDSLPKPNPLRVWQEGKEKWHVDAPVAVEGKHVFVASAFLDKEKVGDRAVFCLDAETGKQVWRAPLAINPWGGPSLQGNLVVVGGSTIGYDTKALKGAKGEVVAITRDKGEVKWRKEIPAGVVSCVALTQDLAICTATDGKVRAFDLESGERRWLADTKTAYFAPPAVAGGFAYAGDLKGAIHAIELTSGAVKWSLDLGTYPDVKSPGMIYGGPVVQGGRLYAATCNLEGPNARQPTVVVCIGEK